MYPIHISKAQRRKLLLKTVFTPTFSLALVFSIALMSIIWYNSDMKAPIYALSPTKKTEGVIVNILTTNTTVNDEQIVQYYFRFQHEGNSYYGDCYGPWQADIGNKVIVEYLPSNIHHYARIEGMRHDTMGFSFFAIILGLVLYGLYKAVSTTGIFDLLKDGELDWIAEECLLTEAYRTDIQELFRNRVPTGHFRLTYEFEAAGDTYFYYIDVESPAEMQKYYTTEYLVYEVQNPQECELVQEYPKPVQECLNSMVSLTH